MVWFVARVINFENPFSPINDQLTRSMQLLMHFFVFFFPFAAFAYNDKNWM